MSVIAYIGLPGHGKSYQVVSVVILGGLKAGRRVITNIPVIPEAIDEFLIKEGLEPEKMGEIIQVTHEEIAQAHFFPTKKQIESKESEHINTVVQPGDLVVIDEAWEHYGTDKKVEQATFEYLRYHRHDTHPETGVAADIILLSQDIYDIHSKIRSIIEMTVMTTKAKHIGMDSGYRIDIFDKTFLRRKPASTRIGIYEKKYFALYKSYDAKQNSSAKALEKRVDPRQSILNTPFFKYGMPLAFIAFVGALIYGWITYKNLGESLDKQGEEKKAIRDGRIKEQPTTEQQSIGTQNTNNPNIQKISSNKPNANGQQPPPKKQHPLKDYHISYAGFANLKKDEHYFNVTGANKEYLFSTTLTELKNIGYKVSLIQRCAVKLKYEDQEIDFITCDNVKSNSSNSVTNLIPTK